MPWKDALAVPRSNTPAFFRSLLLIGVVERPLFMHCPHPVNLWPYLAAEDILFKLFILVCTSLPILASAASAETWHPAFAVGRGPTNLAGVKPLATPNFQFKYSYNGKAYSDTYIGTSPKAGGSTTITVHLIPTKFVVGGFTADPSAPDSKGKSVIDYTIASPIFDSTTDYKQGKTDIGATQYEDAFERLNLWGLLKKKSKAGYHVLLSPKVETGISYSNVAGATTATVLGNEVVLYNINTFDRSVQSAVAKFPAANLVMFVTTQLYLTSGSSIIGGYHNYTGTQAYGHYTYITSAGSTFAWDVAALSHELGEWMDDPTVNNGSPCGRNEVGDPLEGGQPNHAYGSWPYVVGGVTYHLQDLVTPVYFGAPAKTSANKWFTFQGYSNIGVCSNGS